ncbi:hypothetical protein E4U46_000007 [Claviceps purpurea]|nr:hypothetical protein E4U46_000007 [Claviceps purpurea]
MTSTSKQATTPSEKGESLAQGEIPVSNILPASFWFFLLCLAPLPPRSKGCAATALSGSHWEYRWTQNREDVW